MSGVDFGFMQEALSGLARRQEAIANNIANVETPGYRRQTAQFERLLRQLLQEQQRATAGLAGAPAHPMRAAARGEAPSRAQLLAGLEPETYAGGARNDGNTVNLDQEMTDLATTQLQYAGLTSALRTRLRSLRSVIEGL